jgi:hypothetical protein
MRDIRQKKNIPHTVKFPLIKDKNMPVSGLTLSKGIKL